VAKGHNFPRLHLVGVVDADLGSAMAIRAPPEGGHLAVAQPGGSAGAGRDQGAAASAICRTHQPDTPVMKALVACDARRSTPARSRPRERTGYPPFGRLASLIIPRADRPTARGFAQNCGDRADRRAQSRYWDPRAPLAVIKRPLSLPALGEVAAQSDCPEYLREWLEAARRRRAISSLEGRRPTPQSFL